MGAMAAGRASHTLCSSPSRTPKLCSKTAYMIRPIPKEGSITEGTMSTTVCVCGGGGDVCRCARFSQNCGECVGHSEIRRSCSPWMVFWYLLMVTILDCRVKFFPPTHTSALLQGTQQTQYLSLPPSVFASSLPFFFLPPFHKPLSSFSLTNSPVLLQLLLQFLGSPVVQCCQPFYQCLGLLPKLFPNYSLLWCHFHYIHYTLREES